MKEEQEENKRQLEGGLKNVIDELKTEMAGKSFEQSEELNKLRLKVSVVLHTCNCSAHHYFYLLESANDDCVELHVIFHDYF